MVLLETEASSVHYHRGIPSCKHCVYTFFFFLDRNSMFSELKMEVFDKIWWQGQSWRNQKHFGGLIMILINWRVICNNKRKASTKRLLRRKKSDTKYRLINIKYSIYKSCFIKNLDIVNERERKSSGLWLDLQIKSKISFANNKMPVLEMFFLGTIPSTLLFLKPFRKL